MAFIVNLLPAVHIVISVLLIGGILLQQRGAGLGGAFGGSDAGETYYTRRGAESVLFRGTITLSVLFVLVSLLVFLT